MIGFRVRKTLAAILIVGLAVASAPLAAEGMGLVGSLVGDLGVSEAQAIGGSKALLGVAKAKLGDDEFGKLLEGTPELGDIMGGDVGGMAAAAGGSMAAAGAMDTVSEMAGEAGGLAALAGNADLIKQFTDLGLDAGMIEKFAGTLLDTVGGGGPGSGLMSPKTELLRKGLGLL